VKALDARSGAELTSLGMLCPHDRLTELKWSWTSTSQYVVNWG
jgi:hypothetical protein